MVLSYVLIVYHNQTEIDRLWTHPMEEMVQKSLSLNGTNNRNKSVKHPRQTEISNYTSKPIERHQNDVTHVCVLFICQSVSSARNAHVNVHCHFDWFCLFFFSFSNSNQITYSHQTGWFICLNINIAFKFIDSFHSIHCHYCIWLTKNISSDVDFNLRIGKKWMNIPAKLSEKIYDAAWIQRSIQLNAHLFSRLKVHTQKVSLYFQ